jgi:hypothetical protein
MRIVGALRGFLAATAVMAAAAPAWAINGAYVLPGQPLVQAHRVCAMGIVALNRRCTVLDFAKLGVIDHRAWYYAFYSTHWADRHGRMTRGFPVFFYLQKPATLRLGLWVNDAPGIADKWAKVPPIRPVLIRRPDATYLGLSLKAVKGPDDQRLFRLDKTHWRYVEILHRKDDQQAKIDAAVPDACKQANTDYFDWPSFRLVTPLVERDSGANCGALVSTIDIRDNHVAILSVTTLKPGAPLTSAPADHTSPSR